MVFWRFFLNYSLMHMP